MNKYITTIFLCLIFFYNSTAQITSEPICPEGYKYSDDDVIISTIQYFDTLYCIHNINVSHEYIRSHIFANKAEFFSGLIRLICPQWISAKKSSPNTCSSLIPSIKKRLVHLYTESFCLLFTIVSYIFESKTHLQTHSGLTLL